MSVNLSSVFTQRSYFWTQFKAVVVAKECVLQCYETDESYTIWGYDGPEVHITTIWKGVVPEGVVPNYSQSDNDTDLTDFETNFLPTINARIAPPETARMPIVAPTFLHASEQARLEGYELTCEPNSTSILDIEVTTQMLVQGGQFWVMNCVLGDKASFSIVDKNDVVGLHTQLGVPLGTPIELVKYVKNYRFPTSDLWREEIIMPTVAPITIGLFLRATYEATNAGTTRTVGTLYRWYIGQ